MTGPELFAASGPEEVLVVEERAHLRPAQVVESKLTRLLQEAVISREPPPDERTA